MVNLLKYAKKVSNKDLKNLTKSIAYASKKSYIEAVDNMYKEVITGAYDYEKSIKKAVNNLTNKGITLTTKNGRNEQIDVAVKRSLYTSIHQTAQTLSEDIGKQIGANCVVIEHSPSCRPTHHPIDAVIMSLKEFEKYEYLTQEPNCNHIVNYDWQPKFDTSNQKEYLEGHQSLAKTVYEYNKNQKSNYYARQVREKKRKIASGDNTPEAKKQLKLAQSKLRIYNKTNGIEQDYFKTWTAGYNK